MTKGIATDSRTSNGRRRRFRLHKYSKEADNGSYLVDLIKRSKMLSLKTVESLLSLEVQSAMIQLILLKEMYRGV